MAHLIENKTIPAATAVLVPICEVGCINLAVAALDFERLKWKLSCSSEAKMSVEICALAEREYRRFLTLKVLFPDESLVPTKLMDEFWHAHILDTAVYARDCRSLFGRFMHHFPYFGIYGEDDKRNLDNAFAKTQSLYESIFGESAPKMKSNAARCEDHPCHAKTSCACRGPGTCKHEIFSEAARCGPGHSCHVKPSCACREPGACK